MDLFNIALGEDIVALPPEYGMLDFEFVENDNNQVGSLDEIINGTRGWAVHFSGYAGKPLIKKIDPDMLRVEIPHVHHGYFKLFEMWNQEAREVCPAGSFPEDEPITE